MLTKIGKNSIPSLLSKPWTLRFKEGSATPPPTGLEDGDPLTFTGQVGNLDTNALIGVVTDKAGKQYPLNGQIDEQRVVTFFVTSGVSVYFFKGTALFDVGEMSMVGRFTRVTMGEQEDGNWSATATPPPDEDEERRRRHEHALRGSR